MNPPDTSRVVETFIPIDLDTSNEPVQIWQTYIDLLRGQVLPLVRQLQQAGVIRWHSCLVHNRASGVPTTPDDERPFLHLRFELAASMKLDDVTCWLPAQCILTQMMPGPHPHPMAGIEVGALRNADISEAGAVLGETSEWILAMLESTASDSPVSVQNVCQFLHFFGNALLAKVVGLPMP